MCLYTGMSIFDVNALPIEVYERIVEKMNTEAKPKPLVTL